ncbi:MAG: hypothetical protein Q8R25_03755 [bacterium]|nr:hypothetical protein [bacterium]
MKTIFITIFEGVEGKNIIRTGVLDHLLKDASISVVLLVKDTLRVLYYQKTLTHPRIKFEVAGIFSLSRADRVLSKTRYIFLHTPSTVEQMRILREQEGSNIKYIARRVRSFVVSNRLAVAIIRYAESFVRTAHFRELFDRYKPSLVVAADPFEDREAILIREAKQAGIRTLVFLNTWDRITARSIIRTLPDRLVALNSELKKDVVRYHFISPKRLEVCGVPQYDLYFRPPSISRNDFMRSIGVSPRSRVIIYAPIGGAVTDSEWEMIDCMQSMTNDGAFGNDIVLLVRFAPNDSVKEDELRKRPGLLYQLPGKRFFTSRGTGSDWELTKDDMAHLYATLRSSSLLVAYATSLSIDAVVAGIPVINIGFELEAFAKRGTHNFTKLPTRRYRWHHYKRALQTGAIRLVESREKLIEWTKRYLGEPETDAAERSALKKAQCEFLDGRSAERLATIIREDYLS